MTTTPAHGGWVLVSTMDPPGLPPGPIIATGLGRRVMWTTMKCITDSIAAFRQPAHREQPNRSFATKRSTAAIFTTARKTPRGTSLRNEIRPREEIKTPTIKRDLPPAQNNVYVSPGRRHLSPHGQRLGDSRRQGMVGCKDRSAAAAGDQTGRARAAHSATRGTAAAGTAGQSRPAARSGRGTRRPRARHANAPMAGRTHPRQPNNNARPAVVAATKAVVVRVTEEEDNSRGSSFIERQINGVAYL